MLARREVELMRAGKRFITLDLLINFPDRSQDSIKSKRRQNSYRAVLEELLELDDIGEAQTPEATTPNAIVPPVNVASVGTVPVDRLDNTFRRAIVEYVGNLPALIERTFTESTESLRFTVFKTVFRCV